MPFATKRSISFVYLVGLLVVVAARQESRFFHPVTSVSRFRIQCFSNSHRSFSSVAWDERALFVRGGDIDVSSDEMDGLFVTKVRSFIRRILDFGDKKVPVMSKFLRSFLKSVESITGIHLLPKPPKKSKKSKSKSVKSKKAKSKSTKVEEKPRPSKRESEEGSSETEAPQSKETQSSTKIKKPSTTTKKHLATAIKSNNPNYRIQRELKEFIQSPPPNLSVQVGSNIRVWIITMVGAQNTIYEGEVFKLRVSFPPQYPTVPPSVYFLQGYIPIHEHVYTNGDICLSLLGKDWRPTMTAQSIAVSILSILSSAQSKSLPMDNARHATNKPGEYQKDWVYHDDNC